ncbi:hypothetical protein V498_04040 [Pseudogymnoascus sp. VKM F-4517 (FW-2822)]|nr:hypothetical protein V498_04040 [Pseudogymnoascus sp. VKM F-4517 (FW-2822)]
MLSELWFQATASNSEIRLPSADAPNSRRISQTSQGTLNSRARLVSQPRILRSENLHDEQSLIVLPWATFDDVAETMLQQWWLEVEPLLQNNNNRSAKVPNDPP